MYKTRSESMQRGAGRRDREVLSKQDFYKGIKIVLTKAERAHFEIGSNNKFALLNRVEPLVRSFARNGFRKPKDVARLLNKVGVTTARGAKWTPRLAWFLLGFLFDEKTKQERLAHARKVELKGPLSGSSSGLQRKGTAIPNRKNCQPDVSVSTPPAGTLTGQEMATRLATLGRVIRKPSSRSETAADVVDTHCVVVSPVTAKIIARIPGMRIRETVSAGRNAIRALADEERMASHADARELIRVINEPVQRDEFFDWPSTEADDGADGLDTHDWENVGALQFMGYKVGYSDGEPQRVRERILEEIFAGPIPPVFPASYLDEWGEPCSAARLRKMAEGIASFARNANPKRGSRMQSAIKDWEQDLEFLYMEYYVSRFHFAWPDSKI